MDIDEIKHTAKSYAETNVRLLSSVKAQNYNDCWSAEFAGLVREQKRAVKYNLNLLRLDPNFQIRSFEDLFKPQYRSGTEEIGVAINIVVDAVFSEFERENGAGISSPQEEIGR
jgi:hypothetical protein